MSEKQDSKDPSYIVGVSAVEPLDDGGVSKNLVGVISDGSPEKVQEMTRAIYGEEVELIKDWAEQALGSRKKSSMGYSGKWNSSWDPKGPERTGDGLILQ